MERWSFPGVRYKGNEPFVDECLGAVKMLTSRVNMTGLSRGALACSLVHLHICGGMRVRVYSCTIVHLQAIHACVSGLTRTLKKQADRKYFVFEKTGSPFVRSVNYC